MTTARGTSAVTSRIEALKQKHAALKSRIDEMRGLPSTTDFYLNQLKKQKLMLKEQIEGIRTTN